MKVGFASKDITPFADRKTARRKLYWLGPERFHDALLLAIVEETRESGIWRATGGTSGPKTAPRTTRRC